MPTHYDTQECSEAIEVATGIINTRTKALNVYTRGTNDCAAFLAEYDKALRGPTSRATLDFTWGNPREFLVKLKHSGYTVSSYLEHCGYELVKNKRPLVGDVAFSGGALIASKRGWLSTSEENTGVQVAKQLMYLELRMAVIARPIKE